MAESLITMILSIPLMKLHSPVTVALFVAALLATTSGQTPITPGELLASPKLEISGGTMEFTVQPSVPGRRYQLQCSDSPAAGKWQEVGAERTGDGQTLVISIPFDPALQRHFYRLMLDGPPSRFVLIPGGTFMMGDQSPAPGDGDFDELPVHIVNVSPFLLQTKETTAAEWDSVRNWALLHGYTFANTGAGKAANHPVHSVNWFDVVKWCNARSQQESLIPCYYSGAAVYMTGEDSTITCDFTKNGYRLPTEAEWEHAARGGSATRFPWGNTITHTMANYRSSSDYLYDASQTRSYHPDYETGSQPFTAPVGSFAPNANGLHDMTGNIWEWCWDWWDGNYYAASPLANPHGPASGSSRILRGGSWYEDAFYCRVAFRNGSFPSESYDDVGFRPVRGR